MVLQICKLIVARVVTYLRQQLFKFRLVLHVWQGKPLIYNCTFLPHTNVDHIQIPSSSPDVLIINCRFLGGGVGIDLSGNNYGNRL